jgi:hypothetical protein
MFQETQEREERNLCLVKQKKTNGTDPPTSVVPDKDFQFKMKMVKYLL